MDLSSTDASKARDYYAKLFGWKVEVAPDPEAGGYALAKLNGKDVAGIGPAQTPDGPSEWMVYIGTKDADETERKVEAAGGKVIAAPFDVLKSGRMAVFRTRPAADGPSARFMRFADVEEVDTRAPELSKVVAAWCALTKR